MNWFDKIERKFGRYAIKNLMWYIIALYAFGFIIQVFYPAVYAQYLSLDAAMILKGEVWRIVTFIMQPPSTSFFWIIFSLYMYYMIGTVLENVWGAFRFNLYFFMGVILNVLAAIIVYVLFGLRMQLSTHYINLALFMAFATIAPDTQLLLFFFIPIKIKWLAYIDGAFIVLTIICGYLTPFMSYNFFVGCYQLGLVSSSIITSYANSTAAFVAMLNFFVFYLMTRKSLKTRGQKAFIRAVRQKRNSNISVYKENDNKETHNDVQKIRVIKNTRHKCAVCGRTEEDSSELEFRYCSKCEGAYEYCSEHLYTHVHVKNSQNI